MSVSEPPGVVLCPAARRPRGFTMVELLITMAIIAMLAALMLGAVQMSREAAREMKTEATIRKIDGIVMDLYESYRSRRVAVNTTGMRPDDASGMRLLATRDLMRLEMPERWVDVRSTSTPPTRTPLTPATAPALSSRPALAESYYRLWYQALYRMDRDFPTADPAKPVRDEGRERLNRYASAECLYMIVSLAGGPDARGQFHENEVGDADLDGLLEFHDGWGNPIQFLRWAPGLTDLPLLQAQVFFPDPLDPMTYLQNPGAVQTASQADHDPFDHRNLNGPAYPLVKTTYPYGYAYRLAPYIYSAGPDGVYDINIEGGYRFSHLGDPYFYNATSPAVNQAGIPFNGWNVSVTAMDPPPSTSDPSHGPKVTSDSLDHFDNIANHGMGMGGL